MSDVHFDSEQLSDSKQRRQESECDAVCINASRIYDSCGAKDCLSDLPLWFSEDDHKLVNSACSVKICNASIITTTVDVEPVAFHKGFYAVDSMFYFAVTVDVYSSSNAIPKTITGLAMYGKRSVLFGSDGCVKTFTSDEVVCKSSKLACNCDNQDSLPRASVQVSAPMALSAKLKDCHRHYFANCCNTIPQCVRDYFDCELIEPENRYIAVIIGIFSITQLERDVQLMIPSYDFCIPRRECKNKTDDPCEVFSKIDFPTDCFFPPKVGTCELEENPFECDCRH